MGQYFPAIPLVHEFDSKDRAMVGAFQHYWGNMATFGDPNGGPATHRISPVGTSSGGDGLPVWSPQNESMDMSLVMDVPPAPQTGLYAAKCDYWDAHMAPAAVAAMQ